MGAAQIKDAIRKVKAAKLHLAEEIARTFPTGGNIHWDKYGHRQHGTVLHHSASGGNVRVKNERTGKSYWIGMYDVFGYVK